MTKVSPREDRRSSERARNVGQGWLDATWVGITLPHSPVTSYHYDPYAQALSKIERGHRRDAADVAAMLRSDLVRPNKLVELFEEIEPLLYRYPAIDPPSFRRAVEEVVEPRAP